jgi:tetratricopeptide (TPR) repeat protein
MILKLKQKDRDEALALTAVERNQRHRLIFQDAVSLLGLVGITILIAAATYFFFQLFQDHQRILQERWYARGQRAMAAGDPQYAVQAYQSALSLSTANPTYELALAEALAASNRNQEAYAYFSSLHAARPGDGYLNLQLARLAVKRMEPDQAIASYRAALTGLWPSQGVQHRFRIRLELSRYLMSLGRNAEAQGELLTAEGNSLDHPGQLLEVAELLRQAGDPSDAFIAYRRVELHTGTTYPQLFRSLQAQAHVAVSMGQYKRAARALRRYLAAAQEHPSSTSADQRRAVERQLTHIERLTEFIPFSSLAPPVQSQRILRGAKIAHQRYKECGSRFEPKPGAPPPQISPGDAAAFAELGSQWKQFGRLTVRRLTRDASLQQSVSNWTGNVEKLAASLCGAPTGDDAILLQLVHNPDTSE